MAKATTTKTKGQQTKQPVSTIEFLHSAFDARILCRYILMTIQVGEFLRLVKPVFESQGSIEGQRDVVRTATATRIRKRMAEDLERGAIIPPIVLGATTPKTTIDRKNWNTTSLRALIRRLTKISVIDGMQRTAVLLGNENELAANTLRLELWLAPSTENLVYRMLVLNTGQIPWNLRRQLEVVHQSLIDEIRDHLKGELSIHKADDKQRRTSPGEFQGNDVIEMYLAFNLRKPHVDKESVLADQFSKLDLIEAVSKPKGFDGFIAGMRSMLALDKQFSKAKETSSGEAKFRSGRHIFDKVSACAGFMAAYSQFIFGKIGMDRPPTAQAAHAQTLEKNCNAVEMKLTGLSPERIREFLALETLREVSEKRAGALSIGEQERELFLAAFKLLFEEGENLESMEPCWRSQ